MQLSVSGAVSRPATVRRWARRRQPKTALHYRKGFSEPVEELADAGGAPFNASPARYDSSMANENAIIIAPELWKRLEGKVSGRRVLKALSVRQPFANLIADGSKTIEVRTRGTTHRGPLLIVSSKRPDVPPAGCAVAVVNLVDSRPGPTGG